MTTSPQKGITTDRKLPQYTDRQATKQRIIRDGGLWRMTIRCAAIYLCASSLGSHSSGRNGMLVVLQSGGAAISRCISLDLLFTVADISSIDHAGSCPAQQAAPQRAHQEPLGGWGKGLSWPSSSCRNRSWPGHICPPPAAGFSSGCHGHLPRSQACQFEISGAGDHEARPDRVRALISFRESRLEGQLVPRSNLRTGLAQSRAYTATYR